MLINLVIHHTPLPSVELKIFRIKLLLVNVRFINKETGEMKEQLVFMGDFPLMTDRGTFVINGTERVVVSQLVRSPGVYFSEEMDNGVQTHHVQFIPARGAWLEFEVDKHGHLVVSIDRKRRQNATLLLRALGIAESDEEIIKLLGDSEIVKATLQRDVATTREDALIEIYRRQRPGEPPAVDSARSLIEGLYFNNQRYDLARVGRYKVNKKLALDIDPSVKILTKEDIVAALRYLLALHAGDTTKKTDDIDHFGNRRVRTVGELVQNQFRIGLSRMERVIRERMATQDPDDISPQSLINIRPIVAAIKEFFGSSQLSQFMDQSNPLAGLTHKRRLSALGLVVWQVISLDQAVVLMFLPQCVTFTTLTIHVCVLSKRLKVQTLVLLVLLRCLRTSTSMDLSKHHTARL